MSIKKINNTPSFKAKLKFQGPSFYLQKDQIKELKTIAKGIGKKTDVINLQVGDCKIVNAEAYGKNVQMETRTYTVYGNINNKNIVRRVQSKNYYNGSVLKNPFSTIYNIFINLKKEL